MQLFYDNIVFALQRFGGISTYWYELTTRFLKERDVQMQFFETGLETDNVLRPLLSISKKDIIEKNRGGIFVERFLRTPIPDFKTPAVFHSSYFRVPQKKCTIKKVCTVHDFTHDKFHSKARVMLHNISKRRAIEESDVIITVSQHTKQDLQEFYPHLDPAVIFPIYNGANTAFKKIPEILADKAAPYFLYIGSREKYKNFAFAVELVAQKSGSELYIVGGALNKVEENILNTRLGSRYSLFSNLSVERLNELYNRAFCLLYPSSYEGFGIPLLEAMQAGCPFIALNASSIPEVAGNAGVLLNKPDIEEGLEAIRFIEDNYEKIRQAGFRQAAHFSWDKCFEQTKALYHQLCQ